MSKLAYSLKEAASATGLSTDIIRRAVRSGDIAAADPRIEGRAIQVIIIPRAELERWLENRVKK